MKIKISDGNSKLGKIPNVSLTPIKACPKGIPCSKDCYALKAYRCYKNTRLAWDHNLDMIKKDQFEFIKKLDNYLKDKKPKYFRFHVAGDFINKQHVSDTIWLCKRHPKTKFLAFTKQYGLFKGLRIPDNLQIIFSSWPRYPLPKQSRFPIAFMQDGTETRFKNALECPGNCETCGMCWQLSQLKKNVVFHKH